MMSLLLSYRLRSLIFAVTILLLFFHSSVGWCNHCSKNIGITRYRSSSRPTSAPSFFLSFPSFSGRSLASKTDVCLYSSTRANNKRTNNNIDNNVETKRHGNPKNNRQSITSHTNKRNVKKPKPLDLIDLNQQRMQTAGKIGSINFQDPTRLFIGNLNFTCTKQNLLYDFLAKETGWGADNVKLYVKHIQLVTDWKTKQSKGYSFVTFTQPIYATTILHNYNGYRFMGRPLSIKPAKNKLTPRQKRMVEKRQLKELRKQQEEKDGIIRKQEPEPEPDFENEEFLQLLDPDLIVRYDNSDDDDDDLLWEEEESSSSTEEQKPVLNRAQRRKQQREQPKVKPESKGFGS